MRFLTPLVLAATMAFGAHAAAPDTQLTPLPAYEVELDDFLWSSRLIVVFADTEADPRFADQIQLLQDRAGELLERDVVVITDTDPDAMSSVRIQLRPRGFMMVLIGKDGGVKLRKPFPWDVREISRVIDKTPLRKQELRDIRGISP